MSDGKELMNTAPTGTAPEMLRASMVDRIKESGHARSGAVEEALRTVPRHEFVPDASVEDAYADIAVITKRDSSGAALICASVPTIVAMMLDQLDVRPGQRILEIGAGTGYNAALLTHLTGPAGQVTTIDIDPEATAHARRALDATGYGHVQVITCDGALGDPDNAPYDRIIVTVDAWDLPAAWRDQLVPNGRLVVPLRWRGQTRSVALTRDGDLLRSDTTDLCGFVPMIGQDGERTGHIDAEGHVALYWDADQPIDPAVLSHVLTEPKTTVWSGATVGPYDPFDGVWLNLTATEPATCRIAAARAAVDSGLCTPAIPVRSPALVEGDSLAYFTLRQLEDSADRRSELGAIGHGPTGTRLAERLCEQIRAWDHDRTVQPRITACPADASDEEKPHGLVIDKRNIRLVVS